MLQRALLQLPKDKTIDIEFENLVYTVAQGRKGRKQIVKGVSGKYKSGELTAIMGPSGAGKSTLLNILTGFQVEGVQGSISCSNSNKSGAAQYKKKSCYILQDDHLAPFFTVGEIMTIAANLKINTEVSEKSKQFLIDDVLESLGLAMCRETRCAKLSGGQRKRLSIALELIDNPPIMFLDEPTTGLDSSSSTQCVKLLKSLSQGGRTIVCTIHQPSASIFELFDHVYVMVDGNCIYQGASLNTVPFLASAGYNCPKYHNPADYLIEVANGEYGESTDILMKASKIGNWRTAQIEPKLQAEEERLEEDCNNKTSSIIENHKPPSEYSKFLVLLKRSLLQLYRDWTISHLKALVSIMVGVFLGVTYLNYGQDGSKTINNVGLMIISVVYLTYTSLMPSVLKFPSELAVLRKERFNNWYKLKTYYAAFLVCDIPFHIIQSFLYTVITYTLSKQPYELNRYLMVQCILALVSLSSSSFGLILGTVVNPINGTFFGAICMAIMLSVGGFLIFFTHMQGPLYLITYLSFISFATEGLVEAIYGFNRTSLPCPDDVEYCHYRSPHTILKELGMDKENYWIDVVYLMACFILFRIIAFCTLRRSLSKV